MMALPLALPQGIGRLAGMPGNTGASRVAILSDLGPAGQTFIGNLLFWHDESLSERWRARAVPLRLKRT